MYLSLDHSESSINPKILFILGSPRVGSTLVYQVSINYFDLYYPSNHLNALFESDKFDHLEFTDNIDQSQSVNYHSNYGKTSGADQPSEASALFRHFFGGNHPSELNSKNPLPGYEKKFIQFIERLYVFTANHKPLVFKNAWNCFRIKYLSEAFPNAFFLWIRRDISDAAFSDLVAREKRGDKNLWNSATTKNYQEIQKLSYWEQVVEQQYFYSNRISEDLSQLSPDRYCEIWYENLCTSPTEAIGYLQSFLTPKGFGINSCGNPIKIKKATNSDLNEKNGDKEKILKYCSEQRFSKLRFC